jgi:hypothetical protein
MGLGSHCPARNALLTRRTDALRRAGLALCVVCLAATAAAQPAGRRATNIAALAAYPSFYHLRSILVLGTVAQQQNGHFHVSDSTGSLRVIPEGSAPDGLNEVRGQFWDLGRMKADDPRLAGYDLQRTFQIDPEGGWPRPGEITAIVADGPSSIVPAAPAAGVASAAGSTESPGFPATSIRSIVLDPSRYVGQKVTITGQFYGRNLAGDLADSPRQSRYDFVLRAADAAMWVTNMRPRGKDADGDNFELGLDARIDTGKWLRVSGTVQQARGLLWIDAAPGTFAVAQAPTDVVVQEEVPVRVPAGPPPEVIFSTPTEAETDVVLSTNIRIQFSRDVDPATFKGRIRASYADTGGGVSGAPPTAPIEFTTRYVAFNRVLEVTFTKPLERFRALKLELLEGIMGTDQQQLKPWTLTFLLGPS